MNNTGSLDQPPEDARRPLSWVWLLLGGVTIVVALVIGVQVIGVLYAIAFPPAPPVPDIWRVVSHTSTDYGVDDWLYTSVLSACELIRYYQDNGATCRLAPVSCGGENTSQTSLPGDFVAGQHIGRCYGESKFSIFAQGWQVNIAYGPNEQEKTQFRVTREIFWTGEVPPRPELE